MQLNKTVKSISFDKGQVWRPYVSDEQNAFSASFKDGGSVSIFNYYLFVISIVLLTFSPARSDDYVACQSTKALESLAACTRIIERGDTITNKLASAYFNRGVVYTNSGKIDLAISDYTKVIELNPKHADAFVNRGSAYRDTGDLKKSLDDYGQALKIAPRLSEAFHGRSIVFALQGELNFVVKDLDQAIIINPNDSIAFFNRGIAQYKLGNIEAAVDDIKRTLKIDPYNREAKAVLNQITPNNIKK